MAGLIALGFIALGGAIAAWTMQRVPPRRTGR